MALQNNYINGVNPDVTNSSGNSGTNSVASPTTTNTANSSSPPTANPTQGGSMQEYLEYLTTHPEALAELAGSTVEEAEQFIEEHKDDFRYTGKNTFWGWLTGANKRNYEEAYNNWLAHRDDTYLDRNKDAYERNGLNYAALAGQTTTNSLSGSTPDFGDGGLGALSSLAGLGIDAATGGMDSIANLMLGKEKIAGQKISNLLASYGIPEASFKSSVYSMLGSDDSQNLLHSVKQSFANQASSTDNEALRLANEELELFVDNLMSSQGLSVDDNGRPQSLNPLGLEYVSKNNRFIQGNLDFDYNQTLRHYNSVAAETNHQRSQFELDKAKRDDSYEYTFLHAMQQAEFDMRQKLSSEQAKALQDSNFFYDAVMGNDSLSDKQKASILMARKVVGNKGGTFLNNIYQDSKNLYGGMNAGTKLLSVLFGR